MLKNHISFWLELESSTLLNRIKNSTKRPLAVNKTNNDLKNYKKRQNTTQKLCLKSIVIINQKKK